MKKIKVVTCPVCNRTYDNSDYNDRRDHDLICEPNKRMHQIEKMLAEAKEKDLRLQDALKKTQILSKRLGPYIPTSVYDGTNNHGAYAPYMYQDNPLDISKESAGDMKDVGMKLTHSVSKDHNQLIEDPYATAIFESELEEIGDNIDSTYENLDHNITEDSIDDTEYCVKETFAEKNFLYAEVEEEIGQEERK